MQNLIKLLNNYHKITTDFTLSALKKQTLLQCEKTKDKQKKSKSLN